MTDISIFRPELKLAAAGLPEVICDRIAWRTLNDWFQSTEAWKVELTDPMDYDPSVTTYDPSLLLPTGAAAARVVSVRWRPDSTNSINSYGQWSPGSNNKKLRFFTREALDAKWPGWETDVDLRPWRYTSETSGTARLHPAALQYVPSAVEMTVACTIAAGFTTFPDWMYQNFVEQLLPGMYARLYLMPKKDWSDLKLGAAYKAEFEASMRSVKSEAESDYGRPTLEVSYGGL